MRGHDAALRQAEAVLDRFLTAFTAADPGAVVALFWPDALVWGTTMRALGTGPDAIEAYFAPIGKRPPGARRAVPGDLALLALSDSAVLISGRWAVEPGAGEPGPSRPLRLSLTVSQRGAGWGVAQFHSSALPGAPA